jgi:hypothetical protein
MSIRRETKLGKDRDDINAIRGHMIDDMDRTGLWASEHNAILSDAPIGDKTNLLESYREQWLLWDIRVESVVASLTQD